MLKRILIAGCLVLAPSVALADLGKFDGQAGSGWSGAQNDTSAIEQYRRAADKNDPFGQLSLGLLYANGLGVQQDRVIAFKWLTLASRQGNAEAKEFRETLAEKMTLNQIAEARRLTLEWLATHQQRK